MELKRTEKEETLRYRKEKEKEKEKYKNNRWNKVLGFPLCLIGLFRDQTTCGDAL